MENFKKGIHNTLNKDQIKIPINQTSLKSCRMLLCPLGLVSNNEIIKPGMFVFHERYSIKGFGEKERK